MQENQGVDLTWLAKLEIELSRLHAWPIRRAVGNTSRFAQCNGSQTKHDAIKNILPVKCDRSDEGPILTCIVSDSTLQSVVTGRVNIDQDWLPVDHRINQVHWSDKRVWMHVYAGKSWLQQVWMCYGGKIPADPTRLHQTDFTAKNKNTAVTPLDLSPTQTKQFLLLLWGGGGWVES